MVTTDVCKSTKSHKQHCKCCQTTADVRSCGSLERACRTCTLPSAGSYRYRFGAWMKPWLFYVKSLDKDLKKTEFLSVITRVQVERQQLPSDCCRVLWPSASLAGFPSEVSKHTHTQEMFAAFTVLTHTILDFLKSGTGDIRGAERRAFAFKAHPRHAGAIIPSQDRLVCASVNPAPALLLNWLIII